MAGKPDAGKQSQRSWGLQGRAKRPGRTSTPEEGYRGASPSPAHILSLCSGQREARSQRLPKPHLGNKAGNVFHLGPRSQLSLQQWVAFKPNI